MKKIWNADAEWAAKKAGYPVEKYEEACREYAEIVHSIAKEWRRCVTIGNGNPFDYQMSVDKQKHAAHDRVVFAIKENEAELRRLGLAPIYQGELVNGKPQNRQEAGKFAMEICGYFADAEFAN